VALVLVTFSDIIEWCEGQVALQAGTIYTYLPEDKHPAVKEAGAVSAVMTVVVQQYGRRSSSLRLGCLLRELLQQQEADCVSCCDQCQ
jgi:hypothetical protein